jgi:putative transposase
VQEAKPIFTRVCKACGWPQRLRTDHGVPFATTTLARLSQWSAWWVRLGILPERIAPGTPPQHGRHERMHRMLNADTTRPPGATLRAQPRLFTHCREACKHERPHEALDRHTPAACDEPSPRKMPNKLPPLKDPDRQWVNVSHTCVGAYVGLEEIDDGVWNVSFGPLTLGRLLERHMRIEDVYSRLKRHG